LIEPFSQNGRGASPRVVAGVSVNYEREVGQRPEAPAGQIDEQVGKVDPAQHQADRRDQDVVDKRGDDLAERGPMTIPTARSTTEPRTANSLNSRHMRQTSP